MDYNKNGLKNQDIEEKYSINAINNNLEHSKLEIENVFDFKITDKTEENKNYNHFEDWIKKSIEELNRGYSVYLNYDEVLKAYKTIYVIDKATHFYDEISGKFTALQNEKQLKTIIETRFKLIDKKCIYSDVGDEEERKKIYTFLGKFIKNDFLNILLVSNTIKNLKVEINPFLENTKISRNNDNLHLIKNKIYFNSYESKTENIDKEEKILYIKDFHNHFRKFMNILDWIIDCRFADNRRKTYLYLRMNAGFGKTFFMNLLKEIGIAMSVKYGELTKNPTGLNPMEFLDSICMFIDEFKSFGADLKDMTNYLTVTSKNLLRAEVAVYGKIFMSAEKSNSFFGGVDPQIIDRISKIDIESLKLEDRELYRNNPTRYYAVIKEYCWKYLTIRLNEYLSKDNLEATSIADKRILKFYEENGLKAESLDEVIRSLFYDTIKNILAWREDIKSSARYDKDIQKNRIELSKVIKEELEPKIVQRKKDIVIKEYEIFFNTLIKTQTESFYKKAQYKATQVAEILRAKNINKDGGVRNIKVAGEQARRALVIDLEKIAPVQEDLEDEMLDATPIIIKDKNGNIEKTIYKQDETNKLIDENGNEIC